MGYPTFQSFDLNDTNFITERVIFKGFADREVIQAKINRREGMRLLASEFGGKEITIEGRIVADSATQLQTLIDNLKKTIQEEEGALVVEAGRTFSRSIVKSLVIPDEHYNQSTAPYEIVIISMDPYAEGPSLTVNIPVQSGIQSVSGTITISGTFFNRPTIVYIPGASVAGHTNITKIEVYHTATGQTTTVSGFGEGTDLDYSKNVTVDMESFSALEGAAEIQTGGGFAKWDPGTNQFVVTATPRFPGGTIQVSYNPRYV